MRKVCQFSGSRRLVVLAVAGAAASLAGCADSGHYGSDPLGNPFASASNDRRPAPDREYHPPQPSPIFSQPLPAPEQTGSLPPRQSGPRYANDYAAPAHESPRLAEAPAPMHPAAATASIATGHGGWSADGGMPVIAGQGESAKIIGERYNVPPDVLLRVNGLQSATQVRPGTRLLIPVYSASMAPAKAEPIKPSHAAREKLAHQAERSEKDHRAKERARDIAEAKPPHAPAKPEPQRMAEAPKKLEVPKAPRAEPQKPQKMAKVEEPVVRKPAVDSTPTASLPPPAPASTENKPEFRWPVRGRIIQGFAGNDGINIAVPDGTPVKAAESGTVAYAGSEIKGYGNLVLIRHPNGYVTAYANNSALSVKLGEQVKRGQTIATSGQSGNVSSPQLHFELRKGKSPVDPTQYLAGAGQS